jgi:methylthioribose-1-phosphate isomerase
MLLNLKLYPNAEKMSFIDQSVLPTEYSVITTDNYELVGDAICRLIIRGAPAIGVSAAMAVAVGIRHEKANDILALHKRTLELCDYFASTRPTAVNLFWALDKMRKVANEAVLTVLNAESYRKIMENAALEIAQQDISTNRKMAEHAASLIKDGEVILTLCNDGVLCSVGYGTAGGAFVTAAKEQNKNIHVYVSETRPLFQGARLTAWELQQEGIPYTIMTDSMMGYAFENKKISMVMLGADRITANGDTANKIGTYTASVLAKAYGVPFYVVAPSSTLDLTMKTGKEIIIEQRSPEEVTIINGKRIAPENSEVLNPAFDVTPGVNISGIITEKGIFMPPYTLENLKASLD